MKFDRLVALLPCQSLEDLDLGRGEEEAEQLLSAWSSLWHPALLASAESLPSWSPAESPPPDPARHLVIVPDCSLPLLPDNWLSRAEVGGACVLRNLPSRQEMVAAALERLTAAPSPGVATPGLDLAADFLALGYCHLQIELLTRKLRYSSNLDEGGLRTAAVAAAVAALQGDAATARGELQSAFDRLHEAREYFYPVETRLLDLTLLAPSTLGEPLRTELAAAFPRNLLCSGEVLAETARCEPQTLEVLKQALAAGRAAVLGGEFRESRLPLLAPEAIAAELARGLAAYDRHLGRRPSVFGRRRFGLTPALPQILERLGFTAAFHCTLDDGRFPAGNQGRIQWEGLDGTTLDALGTVPLDAGRAASFLQLAEKLGDAMGLEQSGTVVLAHWPGRASHWYDDLRRIAAYGSPLGSFSTITNYFDETGMGGKHAHYQPDEYHSPYLRQDAAAGRVDPISRWVRYFHRRAELDAWQALGVMADCVADRVADRVAGGLARRGGDARQTEPADDHVRLAAAIEDSLQAENEPGAALDKQLGDRLQTAFGGFVRQIAGPTRSSPRGCLIVNPWSFSQQLCAPSKPTGCNPWASDAPLVDVPAMGFAWIATRESDETCEAATSGCGTAETATTGRGFTGWLGLRRAKASPPLAEENVLRNEFCEIHFDPHTGAIRSISDYHSRDPRLAQQIALRLPGGGAAGDEADYSIMAADEIAVTSAGPVLGEMAVRGRLMDRQGRRVAGFRQITRLWRGSRVIELLIDLDIDRPPDENPWDSYYAARFAWKDETAELYRSVNLACVPTSLRQIESPHFLDIRRGQQRTTLLCGGLPYHRRFGRKLDTLLVVRGETARQFRLGIGIDVPQPTAAALKFEAPPLVLPDQPPPPTPTGWLFHLDCRNVLATHWAYCSPHTPCAGSSGGRQPTAAGGFRVRLLETEGRGVRLGLRSFRGVASARKINPGEVPAVDLTVAGDRVEVPLGPHQWVEVEVFFT